MRYKKDHKEKTRRRIIEVTAGSIRREGVAGTGVIGLAAELGLTQGALYGHFASKDELVEAAAVEALEQMLAKLSKVIAEAGETGAAPIDAVIDWYLNPRHREARSEGCLISALGGELARQPSGTRQSTMTVLLEALEVLAAAMPDGTTEKAMALYALMAGTLQLSRVAVAERERDAILENGRTAARVFVNA